ncbi:DUF1054 family protein [Levilactobacillus spicheri]|uniref:UPF0637 protein n=2 Tax=Levilactobacillus spicheri TaxID=216463 RepID=A0ABQ0WLW9_9LACO|nr:DUF1054 family protein [Levilactobacillus spicheri]KRL46624.1 hypothetical protein FD37_GL000089 [Levilactobacillus spicheri DSM 15429]GEO65996.1 UPF0637 protein [Levilactobacillus spicheri]
MYVNQDFDIFADPTLAGRLGQIRQILDPKFEETVAALQPTLAELGQPLYPHVALHRRRTKNPPPDTWVALSTSKRGYKRLPHLEIGLWDDRLYIWLNLLDEATNRVALADGVALSTVTQLPAAFQCANDHTDKRAPQPLTTATYQALLADQHRRKHAEWQVGRDFLRGSAFFTGTAADQLATIQATVGALLPVYRELLN